MASLGAEVVFPAGEVCQPFQQPLEEASAGDFEYGEDLGVRGIFGKRHWLYVYVVPHLRNTFPIVLDHGQIRTASRRRRDRRLPRQPIPQHPAGFNSLRFTVLHLGEDVRPPHLDVLDGFRMDIDR